jgi:hypothetical protein
LIDAPFVSKLNHRKEKLFFCEGIRPAIKKESRNFPDSPKVENKIENKYADPFSRTKPL